MAAKIVPVDAIPSLDPATGQILGHIAKTLPADLPELFSRARVAQIYWSERRVRDRRARLDVLRQRILDTRSAIADAIVRESGKPRVEALFADIFVALDSATYFAKPTGGVLRTEPHPVPHHSTAAKAKRGLLIYQPLGVIGIISSWNYPFAIPMSQIIPAVVAGNAVVCKTSEFTPQCGGLIQQLFVDAGFPKDLVTIVQGGGEIGEALIDAGPDKLIFTGSVATGRRVAEACARQFIPTVLELGGKDAMLVLDDADLNAASSGAVWGSYTNCGQVCLSVERIFVVEPVAEEFVRLCVEKTKKLRVGPGSDPNTDVGPLIRPQYVERMRELLDDAVQRGAQIRCGGNARPDLGTHFFEPTVVTGVDATMKLFQEETFGPILAIQVVRDAKEAIARANDSPFALSASIWTDAMYGAEKAGELKAGAVMVNDMISYFAIAEAPHGGSKLSGWGRTHGEHGLLEMVQPKYIDVDRLPRREKPWWYRYGADVERAADAFLQFEFGGTLASRIRHAQGALKTMFRDHHLK